MLKEKMENALNKHLNAELYSWYLYLAMAAHFEDKNFPGFAKWMKLQAQEEFGHAMKFFEFINLVNARVTLEAIDTPPKEWDSFLELFQQVYDHEVKITEAIDSLVNMAIEEKDHATGQFLQWFVNEQVEEVATANIILEKVKLIGNTPNGLFFLDRELGKRQ